MPENEISKHVFESAMKIHKILGPGLLESAYEACLYYELSKLDLKVERQVLLPLDYKEIRLDAGYRVDLLIENKVIIENKSAINLHQLHFAQLLTYLRLSNCKLGMLINFNVPLIKDGVKRVVNNL